MSKSSAHSVIRLRGVRHNNLKNFDLDLPLKQLIVVTGLSGSGKSSLAFDTLFAEGQRRYIETFSPYARQFFDRMDKPQVDSIEGIPPSIAIEQRNTVRTTRSTVGTMTEICEHLKALWPHVAQLHCKQCGRPVRKDSPLQIWESLAGTRSTASQILRRRVGDEVELVPAVREVLITFDLPLSEKLPLAESLALISKQGYQRILLGGKILRLEEAQSAIGNPQSAITIVQDRVKLAPAVRARFIEACEQAYHFGKGKLAIRDLSFESTSQRVNDSTLRFSNRLHCAGCDLEYRDPAPALFSFNHPLGACPACKGFGRVISIDYDLAIPDRSLSLAAGAVKPWRTGTGAESQTDLTKFCKIRRVPMNVPFKELSAGHQRWVIEGDQDYGKDKEHEWPRAWYGVKGYFRWLESKSYKMHVRVLLSRYRAYTLCPECKGARFQPESLLYLLSVAASRSSAATQAGSKMAAFDRDAATKLTLADFYALPIRDALALVDDLAKSRARPHAPRPANDPIGLVFSEVSARLAFLNEVGLGYLTLDRPTRTLSGGETERVNLTTCLGTRLVNTLFVLDEPSVGLHPRDTDRLVKILQRLRDTGNTVVVVEHEANVMRAADQIVDLGPGHGATGGQIVFQGTYPDILKSKDSLTGRYLSARKQIEIPRRRLVAADASRLPSKAESGKRKAEITQSVFASAAPNDWLRIENATCHNLKNLTVEIPLGRFVVVTGVSGSGKTTLLREVLLPALEANLKSAISELKLPATKASERIEDEQEDEAESSGIELQASGIAGAEHLGRVVLVDQSALGKTPRSNPAVYIGAFEDIRELFAQSEAAKQRGYSASAFSFNSAQGQCERCRGAGFEKIEMQFLSDIFIRCPDCNGRRYRAHILDVKIGGNRCQEPPIERTEGGKRKAQKSQSLVTPAATISEWSIADMLDATVDEAVDFLAGFAGSKPARHAAESLGLLQEVGLGYLRLGQPINTLSGGESQRLKLVSHLAESVAAVCDRQTLNLGGKTAGHRPPPQSKPTLFLFDEPTTGLHFDDVRVLLKVFQRLTDAGHSVIVIEHNLDVIKCADWVIDLGPDAGNQGGQMVAQGAPEQIAECRASHTGLHLKSVLKPVKKPQP